MMSNILFSLDPEIDAQLTGVLNEVNDKYFSGLISATVFWQVPPINSYEVCPPGGVDINSGTIFVHPYLKKKLTPAFVIEYIVFHECLHLKIGKTNKYDPHCELFLEKENKFNNKEKAKKWLEKNLFPILPE